MGFKVDFSEFIKYQKIIKATEDDFNYFLRNFLVEMALRVITKTKPRTPKDTGALRNAWQLGEIKGVGKELEIEIFNPMEYATYIEYGHRIVRNGIEIGWSSGRFMLKISIDEINRQMPARYERAWKQFCAERGLKW